MRSIPWMMSMFGLIFMLCPISGLCGSISEPKQASQQDTVDKDLEKQQEMEKLLAIVKKRSQPVKDANFNLTIGAHPSIGEVDADIVVVEFSDFQCRFCRRHMAKAMPHLITDFIEPGQVRYIFFDYPLESKHLLARDAAEAALCSNDQGSYWEMRQYLFQNQKALNPVFLQEHARSIGLNVGMFHDCLSSDRYAGVVSDDIAQAVKLRIRGTPAFFLGFRIAESQQVKVVKRIDGSQPYSVFEKEIHALLEMIQ